MSTLSVPDLVAYASGAKERQLTAAEKRWASFVATAVAGREIDPEKYATFCIEHGYIPEAFQIEVDMLARRASAQKVADDAPRRRELVRQAHQKLDAAREEYARQFHAIQNAELSDEERAYRRAVLSAESDMQLAKALRAVVEAEGAVADSLVASGIVAQIDYALTRLVRKRSGS
jgi:hypothetical protein